MEFIKICVLLGFITISIQGGQSASEKVCDSPLGLENGIIPDDQLTSSNPASPAHYARLNSGEGWVGLPDQNQYITIDLASVKTVTSISLQGHGSSNNFTKTFRLYYSVDNLVWECYSNAPSTPGVLKGSSRRKTVTKVTLATPILARYIAINPVTWRGSPALRLEIYGCDPESPLTPAQTTPTEVTEHIQRNTVWRRSGSPYVIGRQIQVRPSAFLVIHAGVKVIFTTEEAELVVNGVLKAEGAADDRVRFSSSHVPISTRPGWMGLQAGSGEIKLFYTDVLQARTGISGPAGRIQLTSCHVSMCSTGVSLVDGSGLDNWISVQKTTVENCDYGIQVTGTPMQSFIQIQESNIKSNKFTGIEIRDYVKFTISDCLISHNAMHGVAMDSSFTTEMRFERISVTNNGHDGMALNLRGDFIPKKVVTITGSTFSRNNGDGINLRGEFGREPEIWNILENSFDSNNKSGLNVTLDASASKGLFIQKNSFTGHMTSETPLKVLITGNYRRSGTYVFQGNLFSNNINGMFVKIDSEPEYYDTQISGNSFQRILSGPAVDIDMDGANIVLNVFTDCESEEVLKIRRGELNLVHNNTFVNPKADYDLSLAVSFNLQNKVNASFNYWGSRQSSYVRSRVQDFYANPDLIEAIISPFFMSNNLQQTSVGTGDAYYVDATGLAGGQLRSNLTVRRGSLFRIGRTIQIFPGVTMTVEAGAKLLFKKLSGIYVEGTLKILGSSSQSVSLLPDDPSKVPHWSGVRVHNADIEMRYTFLSSAVACLSFTESLPVKIILSNFSCLHSDVGISGPISGETRISLHNSKLSSILKQGLYFSLGENLSFDLTITSSEISKCQEGALTVEDMGTSFKRVNANFRKLHLKDNGRGIFFYTYTNVQLRLSLSDSIFQRQRGFAVNLDARVLKMSITKTKFLSNQNGLYLSVRGSDDCEDKLRISDCEFLDSNQSSELQIYSYEGQGHCQLLVSRNVFKRTKSQSSGALYILSNWFRKISLRNNNFEGISGAAIELKAESQAQSVSVYNNTIIQCKQALVLMCNEVQAEVTHNSLLNNYGNIIVDLEPVFTSNGDAQMKFSHNSLENNGNETVVCVRRSAIVFQYNVFSNPEALYDIKVNCDNCGGQNINATLNYWDNVISMLISNRLFDKRFDSNLPKITFSPYMRDRWLQTVYSGASKFLTSNRMLGGIVSGNVTLTPDGGPYTVVSSIVIGQNDVLIIDAGVTLLFYTNLALTVEGVWQVKGDEKKPVTLKPFLSGSHWSGVEVIQSAGKANLSYLHYLTLEATDHGLMVKGEIPNMDHVTSTGSAHSGMSIELTNSNRHTTLHHLNMSSNKEHGISVKFNGAKESKLQINGCVLSNNFHGISLMETGRFSVSHCVISRNIHSGIYAKDFSGLLEISDSEFEENQAHAILSVANLIRPRSTDKMDFHLSYCVFLVHDFISSQSDGKDLISLQNTAQKSGVWKISNNIFTKNKNMENLIKISFQDGDRSAHSIDVTNCTFEHNSASIFSFSRSDISESFVRLIGNYFKQNDVSQNKTLVNFSYNSNKDSRLTVGNNTFYKNSAKNIVFVSLSETGSTSGFGSLNGAQISENVYRDNIVEDVVKFLAYGINFNNNTLSNPKARCELFVPIFHTSKNITAKYSFWGYPTLEWVIERICSFDKDMSRAIVDYLPYRRSEMWTDYAALPDNRDFFSLEAMYGGVVSSDTELDLSPVVYPVRRSIYVHDDVTLVIPPGLHLRFDKNRGIYVAGKLVIGRENMKTKLSALGEHNWNGVVFNQRYRRQTSDIRLVAGSTFRQGRVEIRHNGQFGTVCDDEFDDRAATVVCKMLGFDPEGGAVMLPGGHFGSGTGPILLDDVSCNGMEDHLQHCAFPGWGVQNCNHNEDVGVACHGENLVKEEYGRVSSLNGVEIVSAKVALTLLGPSVDISKCLIRDSDQTGVVVKSDLFHLLDLKGTQVTGSRADGLNIHRISGLSVQNVTIENSGHHGINVQLSTGHLQFGHITVKNSSLNGIHAVLRNEKHNHEIKMSHSTISDHSGGFGVFLESQNTEKACLIDFGANRFENNPSGSLFISAAVMPSLNNIINGEIVLSKNIFNESGANFIQTLNNVHLTVTDNKFYNGESKSKEHCLLNVGAKGQIEKYNKHKVNVSTNIFKGVKGDCVVKLNSDSEDSNEDGSLSGEFFFNQILQSPVKTAVVVASKRFNLSYNILDNPLADYELKVVARGKNVLHAENNWWGSDELREASTRIYDRKQDDSLLLVNIKPMMRGHIFDCSGVDHCSGNGECVSPDRCRCRSGWKGEPCDDFSCVDVEDCSANGVCVGPNKCHCELGYEGGSCNKPTCIGVNQCSTHGVCQEPDVCVCYPEFSGPTCSECSSNRWGPDCLPCPSCLHGSCDLNTGDCLCESSNWSGKLCHECAPRFYGKDCRPEMHVSAIIPNGGSKDGGTLVHVWGHNFPETPLKIFFCRFGQKIVQGSWLSEDHVVCLSPRNHPTSFQFEVAADGRQDYTTSELSFAYNGKCLLGPCGGYFDHGNCVFGECLCRMPWTGVNCAVELPHPKITSVPEIIPALEGAHFKYNIQLDRVGEMVTWELLTSPEGLSINMIDRKGAELSWKDVSGHQTTEGYAVKVRASNVIGFSEVDLEIKAPFSFTVTANSIQPSKSLQNPGEVCVRGYVKFTRSINQQRKIKLQIQMEHAGTLRLCDLVELIVKSGEDIEGFATTCHHLAGESGIFRLVTNHPVPGTSISKPAFSQMNELGTWWLMGLRCSPDHVSMESYLQPDIAVLREVATLENGSPSPVYVKFVAVKWLKIFPKVNVTVLVYSVNPGAGGSSFPINLQSGEAKKFDIYLKSDFPFHGSLLVQFKTLLGSITSMRLNVRVKSSNAALVAIPDKLAITHVNGTSDFYSVSFYNLGETAVQNVSAHVTNHENAFISLVSVTSSNKLFSQDSVMHPSDVVMVTFRMFPKVKESQADSASGYVILRNSDNNVNVRYHANILTAQKSRLSVEVKGESSSLVSQQQPTDEVDVTLTNQNGEIKQTLRTKSGVVNFIDIVPGYYTVSLKSTNSLIPLISKVVNVIPGSSKLEMFIPTIPVMQNWTFETFGLENRTELQVDSYVFQKVSIPSMEIRPALINISEIVDNQTDHYLEFLVTNNGPMTAENLRFSFPPLHHGFSFSSDLTYLGDIVGGNSLLVKVKVMAQGRSKRQTYSPSDEICCLAILYDFTAGSHSHSRRLDVTITRGRSRRPTIPCSVIHSSSGDQPEDSQLLYSANHIHFRPVTHLSCDCMTSRVKACSLDFQPMAGCGRALSDLSLSTNSLAFAIGVLDTALTCVVNVFCDKCKSFHSNIRCLAETWEFCNTTTRGPVNGESHDLRKLLLLATKVDHFVNLVKHIFGSDKIFSLRERTWFDKFKIAVFDSSEGGLYISASENQAIFKSASLSLHWLLGQFLKRWNNTVHAWESGTLTTEHDGNVMTYDLVQSGWRTYHTHIRNARKVGYTSMFDQFDAALNVYLWGKTNKPTEKCSSVTIKTDQSEVSIGQSFTVTVHVNNTEGSLLQNIKLEPILEAWRDNEDLTEDCFTIGKPSLQGIMGVDGTGRLATGNMASSIWVVTTKECSRITQEMIMYIGCRMTYKVAGGTFDIQLSPSFLTIFPQSDIVLHIFYPEELPSLEITSAESRANPSYHFTLAVMVTNKGYGTTRNLSLVKTRVNINDHQEKETLFNIDNSRLQGKQIPASFVASFGNILKNETVSLEWDFSTKKPAKPSNVSFVFSNSDRHGDTELTSVKTLHHNILRSISVKMESPRRETVPAFLVDQNVDSIPDKLFHGGNGEDYNVTHLSVLEIWEAKKKTMNGRQYLTVDVGIRVLHHGWGYVQISDPIITNILKNSNSLLTIQCKTKKIDINPSSFWLTSIIDQSYLVKFVDHFPSLIHGEVQYHLTFGKNNRFYPILTNLSKVLFIDQGISKEAILVVKATDLDKDNVSFTLTSPSSHFKLNASSGVLSGTGTFVIGQRFNLNITVTDNGLPRKYSQHALQIVVTEGGLPPKDPVFITTPIMPWENVTKSFNPNVTVTDQDEKKSNTNLLIVYIVVGVVVGLIIIFAISCLLYRFVCHPGPKSKQSPKRKGRFDKYSPEAVQLEPVRS